MLIEWLWQFQYPCDFLSHKHYRESNTNLSKRLSTHHYALTTRPSRLGANLRRDATSRLLFLDQSVLADFDPRKKKIRILRLVAFQARVINYFWLRKYARIVVLGHYLFLEAHSCPRASLSGNCSLLGTDNILGQLSVHISSPKVVYCLYSCGRWQTMQVPVGKHSGINNMRIKHDLRSSCVRTPGVNCTYRNCSEQQTSLGKTTNSGPARTGTLENLWDMLPIRKQTMKSWGLIISKGANDEKPNMFRLLSTLIFKATLNSEPHIPLVMSCGHSFATAAIS